MPLLTNEKTPLHSFWGALVPTLGALLLFSLFGMQALAQEPLTQSAQSAIPLADLLQEAEKNNPQIEAARQGWQAAKQVPTQVSTLPDPEFQIQQVNVGSPRPFAGYTNSDFAYIGLGV
ncbi:MAG TPA: TolC family protein, partial [Candidatus Acidoferrum sp.]|nr:TolC family protein [Candidatus Acidoferrum sp.]